jgi:hypothetical protein
MYEYCRVLTSPKFSGRLTGTGGYTAAARWIETQFTGWHLQPISVTGRYTQTFPVAYSQIKNAEMNIFPPLSTDSVYRKIALEAGKDFLPLFYSDSGTHSGSAVFAGWGISAPELGYDDYAGIDVTGKFLLCFRGTPDPSDDRFTHFNEHRIRMARAKERGALGIFYIDKEVFANPNGDRLANFTPAVITEKMANRMIAGKGMSCDSLKARLVSTKKPFSFETGTIVDYSVSAEYFPNGSGYNVVGIVEGSDPTLKKECVVIGAHADHCGQFKSIIFPGADDNASGTAVAMEIGRIFASLKVKPRRSIIVALFGAEEMGLKGSEYFSTHIPEQFTKVIGMLNFDMVGEGDGAECDYSTPELKKTLLKADVEVGILRNSRPIEKTGVQSSDFAPFVKQGIPCISFSSNGPHLSYHQSGDTLYRLNPEIMADIAVLGFRAAYLLADRD